MSKLTFRYSSVSTAHECLRKYQNIYVLGLQPEGHSLDVEFGSALHLGIQECFAGGDFLSIFDMYWDSIKSKPLKTYRFDWDELKSLGRIFLERFNRREKKKFTPFKTEAEMQIEFEGHALQGTADFIGEYEGIPSIADWKTASAEYKDRKILTNEQLYIYAYMAKLMYDYDVKQIVYKVFIKSEERIQTLKLPLTQSKLNDMIDNVRIMVRDLAQRKEFPRNSNCFCSFPEACYGIKGWSK